MSEWRPYQIKQLGEVITGKTPSINNPEDFGEDIMFITPSDYGSYVKYLDKSERKLSAVGVERLANKLLPAESVMVTCIGSDMGKVAINKSKAITNQQINSIIPNTDFVLPDFLYYNLVYEYPTLRTYGQEGTAVPIVNKTTFESIELSLPNRNVQEAIAEVLSSLDDKIDLLHRNNKTLEQLAETIFRQWFVEEEIEKTTISQVIKTTSGGTPRRERPEYYNGLHRWVKSKELSGGFIFDTEEHISEEGLQNSSAKLLPKHTILIAMYGATVGEYGILAHEATCNQAICALIPNDTYQYPFLFTYIKFIKEELINKAIGSAQQNISQDLIKQHEIPAPSAKVNHFSKSTEPIFEKLQENGRQILQLEKLRDTLLPKLMSGVVRVKDKIAIDAMSA